MIYREEKRDLFSVDKDYLLCHCISADGAMGKGIAVKFKELGAQIGYRHKMSKICLFADKPEDAWNGNGFSVFLDKIALSHDFNWLGIINLVTKHRYYEKPTLRSLRDSLISMKINLYSEYPFKDMPHRIAMPKIGCGLDHLNWEIVAKIIKDVFSDTDVEILVCYQ